MNVKMPTGKTIELPIPHPYTIESIKQEISNEEGIPPHCQQLTFTGRVLEDGHTLNDYDIEYIEYKSTLQWSEEVSTCTSICGTCNDLILNLQTYQYLSGYQKYQLYFWRHSLHTLLGTSKL